MTKNDSPIENTITEIKPMVSVIVPVYNAENGLEECVDSVIKKTWENILKKVKYYYLITI